MDEFVTEALVLDKESVRETDARVFLYTKHIGGIAAKVTSARKMTAKLNAHVEPMTLTIVRLVKKNNESQGYQLTDALTVDPLLLWKKDAAMFRRGLGILALLRSEQFIESPDVELWELLTQIFCIAPDSNKNYHGMVLKALGFDPLFAQCASCGGRPEYFYGTDQSFYCLRCSEYSLIEGAMIPCNATGFTI